MKRAQECAEGKARQAVSNDRVENVVEREMEERPASIFAVLLQEREKAVEDRIDQAVGQVVGSPGG